MGIKANKEVEVSDYEILANSQHYFSAHQAPSVKVAILKRKNLHLRGANSFLLQ